MMVGWPSPIYPKLLLDDSPLPITLDLSAMIAGALMIGNTIATPFSTITYTGSKCGILIGLILMTIGWLIMWQARNFYWLLISRLVIGIGNGYGMTQVKIYIKEMLQPHLIGIFYKIINVCMLIGILIVFCVGPLVDFQELAIVGCLFCVIVFILCIALPHTPIEYLRMNREESCKKLLRFLHPENAESEFRKLNAEIKRKEQHLTIGQILRKKDTRYNVIILTCLVYFQQFTGVPATISYSQIIFASLYTDRPEFCAIIYVIVLIVSNIFASFGLDKFNQKHCLLFSSASVSILLAINIYVIYFKYNQTHWNYISFIIMLFYISFHTVGIGSVPLIFLENNSKQETNETISHLFWMLFSMLALILTKIFQVLYEKYDFYMPFCFFLFNSLLCFIFTILFYPNDRKT